MLSRKKVMEYLQQVIDEEEDENWEVARFAEEMLLKVKFNNFKPDEEFGE